MLLKATARCAAATVWFCLPVGLLPGDGREPWAGARRAHLCGEHGPADPTAAELPASASVLLNVLHFVLFLTHGIIYPDLKPAFLLSFLYFVCLYCVFGAERLIRS